jgi:hypothetical protein
VFCGRTDRRRDVNAFLLRAATLALAVALVLPTKAAACYCDVTPFRALAPAAHRVIVGQVLDSTWKRVDEPAPKNMGKRYWVSRVRVSQVVRGRGAVGDIVEVGGFETSCDTGPETVRVGKEFAFALREEQKVVSQFYWLHFCRETAIPINKGGEKDGATVQQVMQWARAGKP